MQKVMREIVLVFCLSRFCITVAFCLELMPKGILHYPKGRCTKRFTTSFCSRFFKHPRCWIRLINYQAILNNNCRAKKIYFIIKPLFLCSVYYLISNIWQKAFLKKKSCLWLHQIFIFVNLQNISIKSKKFFLPCHILSSIVRSSMLHVKLIKFNNTHCEGQ